METMPDTIRVMGCISCLRYGDREEMVEMDCGCLMCKGCFEDVGDLECKLCDQEEK